MSILTTTKATLNQLTVRTFLIFWITFLLMTTALLVIPYFDTQIYSTLSETETATYQKRLVTMVRTNQVNRILAGVPLTSPDRFDGFKPVIVDINQNVIGAEGKEKSDILRFADVADDPSIPQKKVFGDTQLVGPFSVHLGADDTDYSLYFVGKVNAQQEILRYLFNKPWYLLILLFLITTPLLWWFSRTIVKPIGILQNAANIMALGNFKTNRELVTQGPLELRQVGKSFNRMAQAISDLISNQQSLLSSVSHELRTPLTRLQLSASLLRRQVGDLDSLKRIQKEIDQMDQMISDLLMLSRQQMNTHIERKIFPMNELWEQVVQDAKFEAEQKGISFEVDIYVPNPEKFVINGNLKLLKSAVENIVRNALKYTKDKIELKIFLEEEEEEEEEEEVLIRVEDNGTGLHEKEFEKIFNPFYRVDEARTRTTGGTGLGLAIVSSVVREHQGKVWAEKSILGGLAVTIKLPLWIDV